jgi:hypothetical protein
MWLYLMLIKPLFTPFTYQAESTINGKVSMSKLTDNHQKTIIVNEKYAMSNVQRITQEMAVFTRN